MTSRRRFEQARSDGYLDRLEVALRFHRWEEVERVLHAAAIDGCHDAVELGHRMVATKRAEERLRAEHEPGSAG